MKKILNEAECKSAECTRRGIRVRRGCASFSIGIMIKREFL